MRKKHMKKYGIAFLVGAAIGGILAIIQNTKK